MINSKLIESEISISDILILVTQNNLSDKYIADLIPIAWYFANQESCSDFVNFNLNDKCIQITHNPHIDIIMPFIQINLTIDIGNQNYCNVKINGPCSMYYIKNQVSKYNIHYKCNVLKYNNIDNEITIVFYN